MYFIIAAVMFGGGVITWNETGAVQYFMGEDPDAAIPTGDESPGGAFDRVMAVIAQATGMFGGVIIMIVALISNLLQFMHWPVIVLSSNDAPLRITVLLGGSLVAMFYMSMIRLILSAA